MSDFSYPHLYSIKRSLKDTPKYKPAPTKKRTPRQLSMSDDVPCDICKGGEIMAVKSCLVCRESYCEIHLTPHLRDQLMTKHMLTDPGTFTTSHLCKRHGKLLEKFCKTDRAPVCMRCTERDHKHHEIIPMEQESRRIRVRFNFMFISPCPWRFTLLSLPIHCIFSPCTNYHYLFGYSKSYITVVLKMYLLFTFAVSDQEDWNRVSTGDPGQNQTVWWD